MRAYFALHDHERKGTEFLKERIFRWIQRNLNYEKTGQQRKLTGET